MVATRVVPDRWRSAAATRRGVRRPVRAPARPRLRRDLCGHRQRDARLAAAPRDRRPGLRRRRSSGRSTTASCPACRSTARGSSTSTRSSAGRTASPPTPARASAPRGTRAPAARRTSCGRSAAGSSTSRPRTTTGSRSTSTRPATSARAPGRRARRLAIETGYPWDGRVRVRPRDARRAVDARAAGPALVTSGTVDWYAGADRAPTPSRAATGAGDRAVTCSRVVAPGDAGRARSRPAGRVTSAAAAGRRHPRLRRVRARPARVLHRVGRPRRRASSSRTSPSTDDVQPTPVPRPDLGPGVLGLAAAGVGPGRPGRSTVAAVPYHAWANRSVEAMRVWIPSATADGAADATG